MSLLVTGIGFGIISAAILSMSSIGFTLQFGMTNILNLAYGTVMTIAALITYVVNVSGYSIWVAALVGVLFAMVATVAIGWGVLQPFAHKGLPLFAMAMVSVGLSLIGDYLVAAITHSGIYEFHLPIGHIYRFSALAITTTDLVIIGIAVISVAGIELALHRTRLGIAIRATSANASLARASGIPTTKVVNATWLISGLFCGLGGVTLAMSYQSVTYTMGTVYLPYILAVVIVAGIGSVGYAALISLVLSIVIQVAGVLGASSYNVVIALAVLLAMLLIRPKGLFGELFEKTEVAI